jgi:hypothetical protein
LVDYRQILVYAGFVQIKGCSCGGTRQDKFQRDDYIIYVKLRAETFRIKKGNTYLTPSKALIFLDETLATMLTGVN